MYRCKDCGLEYKTKVDYCECGNNTFDYIEEISQKPKTQEKQPKKPLTVEQKSDIISRIFLIVCLILSAIVWAIPVKTQQPVEEEKVVQKVATVIPTIDKIWDSTPPIQEKPEAVKEVVINTNPIPLNTIPDYAKPKFVEQKKVVQEPKKVEPKKVESPKTSTTTKTLPKAEQKNTAKTETQPKTASVPKTTAPKTQTQQVVHQAQNVTKPEKKYNPNSPEMLQYKGSLRAAMFSKFPVGSISGSGTCSVHFSVDSNGKLTNRGFTRQSDNKSLNDAVYYMMMSVPKFTPPPAGYNGETISMTFKIINGEYEISIY